MNDYSAIQGTGFSITTFWVDWVFAGLLCVLIFFIINWARKDRQQALHQGNAFFAWLYAVPLILAAIGALVIAIGMLIREDFWEMRFIFFGFLIWIFSGFFGLGLLGYNMLKNNDGVLSANFISSVGLFLTTVLFIIPLFMSYIQVSVIEIISHIYYALLVIAVMLIFIGLKRGLMYKFPLFSLFIGPFFLTGLGIAEIVFKHCSFMWLIRIWNLHLTIEYIGLFPTTEQWQIFGWIKLLMGFGMFTIFIIALIRKRFEAHA